MHHALAIGRAAPLEERDAAERGLPEWAVVAFLESKGLLGMAGIDTLRARTAIRHEQAKIDAIPVEPPAGIGGDPLNPDIHEACPDQLSEPFNKRRHVVSQNLRHLPVCTIENAQQRLAR